MAALDNDRRNKHPRMLTESERDRLEEFIDSIHYSSRCVKLISCVLHCFNNSLRYSDDDFEYRHVVLPKDMLKKIPKDYFDPSKGTLKLLWEEEWRGLGITQVAAMIHSKLAIANRIYCRVLVGNTTRSTNQSPIFCCSSMFPLKRTKIILTTAHRRPVTAQ